MINVFACPVYTRFVESVTRSFTRIPFRLLTTGKLLLILFFKRSVRFVLVWHRVLFQIDEVL
jgi:hypothetical protein